MTDLEMDKLYTLIDALARAENYDEIDGIITSTLATDSAIDTCVALLSATAPIADKLKWRKWCYRVAETNVIHAGRDVEKVLGGLK